MRLLLLAFSLCLSSLVWGQGSTSSEMRGIVTDVNGEPLIGANVVAVHLPSGTTYGTATNLDGNYQIPGMRVGGPYNVTVSYTGYSTANLENIELRLGETFRRDFALDEANVQLEAVMVVAASGVTGQTAGTSTNISTEKIEAMPTLNRDIVDFLKLTPQANPYSDGISLAGVNNRFNAIYIDGAVNNDMYGISSSGTNGGQTGISPFSIDIIDQFQVVLSPYDVSLGGFAGGGINAVTKSGTNTLYATAYYYLQNESLAGKTHGLLAERLGIADEDRTKLADFTKNTFGASLGGPISRDKLFFFANVEIQNDETPIPYELEQYTATPGRADAAKLDELRNHLINTYGYDPGGYLSTEDELDGLKLFGKLDYNLNENHRLTLRHQYTKAEQYDRFGGSSNTINFSNNGVYFPSTTNSSALQLRSRFGQNTSNDLILGFTTVKDDRDAIGSDFPYLFINDVSNGTIRIGTEEFSTANLLEQSVFTITDNFKIYSGNHTFTIGTHNEFSSFNNIFIGQNFGTYRFASIDDFINGANAIEYDRSYSLVDELSGDETAAAADFNAMQLGFYVQDQWTISPKFTLTGGLRLDIPVITTDPALDTFFANTALPVMAGAYPVAEGVVPGKAPDGQLMFSPRLGFEYAFDDARNTILRGGLGVFTSRIPFVWPGAMFTNNGLTLGRVDETNIQGGVQFRPDVNNQYTNPNFSIPQGQVDIFVDDFKYPQVFRTNLALDTKFGDGFEFSVEGLFTKTMNNVLYTNVNNDPAVKFNWTSGGDDRPVYFRKSLVNTYSAGVYVGSNTSEGYTYNITASLAKDFGKNFNAFIAYNYGDAHSINDGTSSQNSSQWRGQIHTDGRNNPVLGRSDYAQGHRFITSLAYSIPWTEGIKTTISLFYTGESGEAFSYVIGGSSATNINQETGSASRNRSLVYVPIDMNDINLVAYTVGGETFTAEEQWENLNAMIESDPGLRDFRGQYVEKNGSFAPFNHILDLAIRQDLGTDLGGDLHRIQISLDIFNFANLLNKDWGAYYVTPGSDFNNFQLYQLDGYEADGTTPKLSYRLGDATGRDAFNILGTNSRWRMRLGFRYILN
jgi:hypothetical protein